MPLYEYECDVCGHRFEKIQKFSDPRETVCPKCGGVIHKLMSSPAIQFKGSGFYITDYAKKDYVSASKADHESGKSESHSKGEKQDTSAKSGAGDTSASSSEAASSSSSSSGSSSSTTPAPAPAKSTTKD